MFSEPGIYLVELEFEGLLRDGSTVVARDTLRFAVGDQTDAEAAFDLQFGESALGEGEGDAADANGGEDPPATGEPGADGDAGAGGVGTIVAVVAGVVGAALVAAIIAVTVASRRARARAKAARAAARGGGEAAPDAKIAPEGQARAASDTQGGDAS